jgi:hypothetical protein
MATEMARTKPEDTASRISVLESQVEDISADVIKLEVKIDANYATLHHRISDLRDDIHANIDAKHTLLVEKLDKQATNSTLQHQALAEKIQSIEKWRWMIMGGAIVVGYVLAHVKLDNLF